MNDIPSFAIQYAVTKSFVQFYKRFIVNVHNLFPSRTVRNCQKVLDVFDKKSTPFRSVRVKRQPTEMIPTTQV